MTQDFDLAILGAGVAGLTAAVVGARLGLRTAVVERMGAGGQVMNVEKIENFPGFPEPISGFELGPLLQEQAEAVGVSFILDNINALEPGGSRHVLQGSEEAIEAGAVIIAAGSEKRTLGIPGEEQFAGRGVSHCASCDGPLFRGRNLAVVGGGDSALQEALVLAGHAARVTLFHRGPHLDAESILVERAAAKENIEIICNTIVEEIRGDDVVSSLLVREVGADMPRPHTADGVFVYVGLKPNTAFLNGVLALDSSGHIETDILMRTSVDGVFAAGDIRSNSVAYLASAAGDGATAAISAYRYLCRLRG